MFGIDTESDKFKDIADSVRLYLRDVDGVNKLLCDSTESGDANLTLAVSMALTAFNVVAPHSSYTIASLPNDACIFVIYEAVIEVLASAGILHSRNQLSYSSGGLSVSDHSQAQSYQMWAQMISQLRNTRELAKKYKLQKNIDSGYSNFYSEFFESDY